MGNSSKKIVIIGGVAAGTKAATKIKRLKPEYDVKIYTAESIVSYSGCGMPYFIEGIVPNIEQLMVRSVEDFAKEGINVYVKHRCTSILRKEKKVSIKNLETKEDFLVDYDKLLIATGASPFIPPIENVDYDNIFTLRTISDAIKIKEKMENSTTVTIIGGGYNAIELLEAFVHNGLNVTLITDGMYLMNQFDLDMGKFIHENVLKMTPSQVKIIAGEPVIAFDGENNSATTVYTVRGTEVKTDFFVLCTGIHPNSKLAMDAGLETGLRKAIRVNNKMQTSDENIYAAGDCCEKTGFITNAKVYNGLGSIANKEARVAAINMTGGNETNPGTLLSAITKYFDFDLGMAGLTEIEASDYGITTISATATKRDKAGYMPDANNITVKLIANKANSQIIGIQAAGFGDVDKRISAAAVGIQAGMNVNDFMYIDLPYAPPFSSVLDVLHICANILNDKISKI